MEEAGEHEDGDHDAGDGHDAGHDVGALGDIDGAFSFVIHLIQLTDDGSPGSGRPGLPRVPPSMPSTYICSTDDRVGVRYGACPYKLVATS